jgi:hypothetical protein
VLLTAEKVAHGVDGFFAAVMLDAFGVGAGDFFGHAERAQGV